MRTRDFLAGVGAGMCLLSAAGPANSQPPVPLIRWAELDVDPLKLEAFKAAARTLRDAVVRTQPGVAVFHAVVEAKNSSRVHVLEVYDDSAAYETHLNQPHFLAFRATTQDMVSGRQLHETLPVRLGAKDSVAGAPLVRIARLEIDHAQLAAYRAAVSEEIDDSIRLEPGVLSIYALALKDQPHQLRFFEIYADDDAYRRHIDSPHFRKYVDITRRMIRSRQLLETTPVFLSLRPR